MKSKTKPHICVEFSVWLEEIPKEKIALLKKAFRDKCLNNSSIKKQHKEFKDGRKSVHDNCLLEPQFCKTFGGKWPECMQKCILSSGGCYVGKNGNKNEDVSSDSE